MMPPMGSSKRHPSVDQAYQTRRDGDRRGALTLYLEAAVELADSDVVAAASALRHVADLHEELGESDQALRHYKDAWRLYLTLNPAPNLDLANCRRPMALWEERHGSPFTALILWREARTCYEKAAVTTAYDLQAAFDECDRHIATLSSGN